MKFDGFKSAVTIRTPKCEVCNGPSHQNADGTDSKICGWCEAKRAGEEAEIVYDEEDKAARGTHGYGPHSNAGEGRR